MAGNFGFSNRCSGFANSSNSNATFSVAGDPDGMTNSPASVTYIGFARESGPSFRISGSIGVLDVMINSFV